MDINWLAIGWEAARLVFYVSVSLVSGALIFREVVAPEIEQRYAEAQETIKKLGSLAGTKSAEFRDEKNLEKIIASDFISTQIPELEAARLVLSQDSWEKIEEAIERNPAAVISMWEKWKDYFPSVAGVEETKFDF